MALISPSWWRFPLFQTHSVLDKAVIGWGKALKARWLNTSAIARELMNHIIQIPFDNRYAQLGEAFFSRQLPTPVAKPALIRLNTALAELLGIDSEQLRLFQYARLYILRRGRVRIV